MISISGDLDFRTLISMIGDIEISMSGVHLTDFYQWL